MTSYHRTRLDFLTTFDLLNLQLCASQRAMNHSDCTRHCMDELGTVHLWAGKLVKTLDFNAPTQRIKTHGLAGADR